MREILVDKIMINFEKSPKYNKYMLAKIKYGAQCTYSVITKFLGILLLTIIFNTVKEMLLFTLLYFPLRQFAFGYHSSSNGQCWILSIIIFVGFTYLLTTISISKSLLIILFLLAAIPSIYYSPADTKKHPLINRKKTKINKIFISIIFLIYLIILYLSNNNILNNLILGSVLWNLVCVSPTLYIIFNQPYNNYKTYKKV